jgi:hypothetical protein
LIYQLFLRSRAPAVPLNTPEEHREQDDYAGNRTRHRHRKRRGIRVIREGLEQDAGLSLITVQNIAANTANSTVTLAPGQETFFAKAPVDLLSANNSNVLAVGVKLF